MIEAFPPTLLYFSAALLMPFLGRARLPVRAVVLSIPLLALASLLSLSPGTRWTYSFLGYDLVLGRVDQLSLFFGYGFTLISFLGFLFGLHVKDKGQHVAALLYAGSSLGAVFAGDLISLFIFWEVMAVSSTFLIWYRREAPALNAGFRYLFVHLAGGAFLLGGILMQISQTGSTAFEALNLGQLSAKLILVSFLLNAAAPPIHAWLPDAYPEGTVTGSVFLSAFTTKTAVYVLARGFAGAEVLVWLGAGMAVYGVVYALLENDIRRLLAYHIISQVGYMVCGVGLGSETAVNGSTVHAFCNILYKALLFMGAGAVIQVTGRRKITDLEGGGLFQRMPVTLALYMLGALSISGAPPFNGFISKNLVIHAAGELHRPGVELLLHLASVGTFLSVGLKLPWGVWFGSPAARGEKIRAHEPPVHMLLSMGLTAFLCVLTGVRPGLLYGILPYPVDFQPYNPDKVVAALQLLLGTGAAFWLLRGSLKGVATVSLDTDWFYRKFGAGLVKFCGGPLKDFRSAIQEGVSRAVLGLGRLSENPCRSARGVLPFIRRAPSQAGEERSPEEDWAVSTSSAVVLCVFFLFLFGLIYLGAGK